MTWMDTGGLDPEDGLVYDARWGCDDCGLSYSWPVTPGLAPKEDPKQTQMLAIIAEHTPETCRGAQASQEADHAARQAAYQAGTGSRYDQWQDDLNTLQSIDPDYTAAEAMKSEAAGCPMPVSGDPTVTLAAAIGRGAVTITKGLPAKTRLNRHVDNLDKITAAMPGMDGTALNLSQRVVISGWFVKCSLPVGGGL